jgi:hypothetical protein
MSSKTVYFCPRCNGAAVNVSQVAGLADCVSCGWQGGLSELISTVIQHDLGSDEKLLETFATDMRNLFSKTAAKPLALFLRNWGFLPEADPAKQVRFLARYMAAMARAMVRAVIEEREKIEKETGCAPS